MSGVKFLSAKLSSWKISAPHLHVVLGSGMSGAFEDKTIGKAWKEAGKIPFREVPGLNPSTAPGHRGEFRYFNHPATGRSLCFQLGRLHGYEGLTPREVVLPLKTAFEMGTRNFVLTNAAGALKLAFKPGTVMIIRDHVNLTGTSPLFGPNPLFETGEPCGPRFPDMSEVYDRQMSAGLKAALKKQKIKTQEGIYLGLLGPAYETPSEVKLYSSWGLGSVGMSTVWEAMALRHLGARTGGLSLISNMGCGLDKKPLRHEDVERIGRKVASSLVDAVFGFAEGFFKI